MSWRLPGRPSSISSTLRVPPSARVSTSCNTQPIHDPPAGNGPAGHIAPSAHPQSLNTPPLGDCPADPAEGRDGVYSVEFADCVRRYMAAANRSEALLGQLGIIAKIGE